MSDRATHAPSPPSVRRKALFLILTVAFVVLAIEGVARIFYYAAYGEFYARGQLQSNAMAHDNFTTMTVTHPYFGFATPWVHHPLNNMPPLLTHDATLVVGLFGGSVAQQVRQVFKERLAAFLAEEEIALAPIVVELAQGGMKQPQQAHVLAYMLAAGGEFDLIVNLDGHNDVTVPHFNAQRGLFPPYPHLWDKRVGATAADRELLGRAALLEREQEQIEQIASGGLGSSALVGVVLRRLLDGHDKSIGALHQELIDQAPRYNVETHGPRWAWHERENPDHKGAVRELAVEVWYRSSLAMAKLAATAGADYVHFLQPSQYIAESKPLSAEERTTAYEPSWYESNYAETYPLVAQFGARLRQAGVHFVDLTQTFATVTETIYTDTCCHVNPRGARMLATRMVDAIKPTVRRRAKALAESRLSILDAARRPVLPDVLLAQDYYDIYLRDGKWLVYRREACTTEDTDALFFLHITPNNPAMLPADRAPHGFDNLDFLFAHAGVFTADGACVVQTYLPGYQVSRIRTGQAGLLDSLWEVEFDTPALPLLADLAEPAPDAGP